MRNVRTRSANWRRQELLRGVNDYLDEYEDAGVGYQAACTGSGGCRSDLKSGLAVRRTIRPAVRVNFSAIETSVLHWT
ncbi:MAG: hypothetical protein WCT10_01205 [Patescibacteria group bacterium]